MLTCLFWNINNKDLGDVIADLTSEHAADVVIVAESGPSTERLLLDLNGGLIGGPFAAVPGIRQSCIILSRLPVAVWTPRTDLRRASIVELKRPTAEPLLIAAVHLPSKRHMSDASRHSELIELSRAIRRTERNAGHRRTMLIGDLNANPHEAGMVSASGLNAMMSADVVRTPFRKVQNRPRPFFYNPMWSLAGDRSEGPPGTYFYNEGQDVAQYWHSFDQVLIRPPLQDKLLKDGVRVLTTVRGESLMNRRGRPNRKTYSDHLPLLVRIDL